MGQFLEPAFEVNHGLPEGFAATTAVSVIIEVEVPTNQLLVFGVVDSSLNQATGFTQALLSVAESGFGVSKGAEKTTSVISGVDEGA
jgi:hypothetical protein